MNRTILFLIALGIAVIVLASLLLLSLNEEVKTTVATRLSYCQQCAGGAQTVWFLSCAGYQARCQLPSPVLRPCVAAQGYCCLENGSIVAATGQLGNGYCRNQNGSCYRCRCLASTARISTPMGSVAVTDMREGMMVWTQTKDGRRSAVPVMRVAKTAVPPSHEMVRITLQDGRMVRASAGHPTADGRTFGVLAVGAALDGSVISHILREPYHDEYTYDLLPQGETGYYWADGVLLGSTLIR